MRVEPPKNFTWPCAIETGSTCSSNVTSVVLPSDTAVLRMINPRMPGLASAIAWIFSIAERDLPVPALPTISTSGARHLNNSRAAPLGSNSRSTVGALARAVSSSSSAVVT